MSKLPLLIKKPESNIRADSLIDVSNPDKEGAQMRFYVAHSGPSPKDNTKIGMLCFPVSPFRDTERPAHAHAMLRTPDAEELQMIDFSDPQAVMYVPKQETHLVCTAAPDYDDKYKPKVTAASIAALTNDSIPLIEAYRNIFLPAVPGGKGFSRGFGGEIIQRHDGANKVQNMRDAGDDGIRSTAGRDMIDTSRDPK